MHKIVVLYQHDIPNTNENLNTEYKTYILIFGERTIGNVDNSTKIVSSIVGHNKNRRRIFRGNKFGSISAIRSSRVEKVINDSINGKQCGVNITTQQDQNVVVDCISSGNTLIWFIYPSNF